MAMTKSRKNNNTGLQRFVKLSKHNKIVVLDFSGILDKKGGFNFLISNLDNYWSLRLQHDNTYSIYVLNEKIADGLDPKVLELLVFREDFEDFGENND